MQKIYELLAYAKVKNMTTKKSINETKEIAEKLFQLKYPGILYDTTTMYMGIKCEAKTHRAFEEKIVFVRFQK
jgi:hypothetical protein